MSPCLCGCGGQTTARYLRGHNNRNRSAKRYAMTTEGGKLAMVHRVRAERALGKPLPAGALVHHADGSKSADAPLVICPSNAYHALLHARMRVKAAGADPNTHRVCPRCATAKTLDAFSPSRSTPYCKPCGAQYAAARREQACR